MKRMSSVIKDYSDIHCVPCSPFIQRTQLCTPSRSVPDVEDVSSPNNTSLGTKACLEISVKNFQQISSPVTPRLNSRFTEPYQVPSLTPIAVTSFCSPVTEQMVPVNSPLEYATPNSQFGDRLVQEMASATTPVRRWPKQIEEHNRPKQLCSTKKKEHTQSRDNREERRIKTLDLFSGEQIFL